MDISELCKFTPRATILTHGTKIVGLLWHMYVKKSQNNNTLSGHLCFKRIEIREN